MENKRILIDIGHPAHVHLFKYPIKIWLEHGHSITITIREKDITGKLLEIFGLPYKVASSRRQGFIGLAIELLEHDWGVYKAAKKSRSNLLLGTSVSITHVSRLLGAKSIVFNEDDYEIASAFTRLAYPMAHAIVTPDCLKERHGSKHITYKGYQKLAYLHPNTFTPNPDVLSKLGLRVEDRFFIIRLVSLVAAHDRGVIGLNLSLVQQIISFLSQYGNIFLTSEEPLNGDLEQYALPISLDEIHDVLYYANMFIGDSQSMTTEAALLGTPAIRFNSFAKHCSVLQELEHKYELIYSFLPSEEQNMLLKIRELVDLEDLDLRWEHKRQLLLSDKIDVTAWLVDFVENYPQSMNNC